MGIRNTKSLHNVSDPTNPIGIYLLRSDETLGTMMAVELGMISVPKWFGLSAAFKVCFLELLRR